MQRFLYLLLLASLAIGREPNKQPFRIVIEAERTEVKAGSDVWLKLSLTNNSDRDLDEGGFFVDGIGLDPNFHFDVRDESGKLAPKRTYPHPELQTGKPVSDTIAPGETLTQEQRVSALYDMRKPGKYIIRVSRRASDNPKDGEIKSNAVTVTVVP